jgi:leucyl-tRNA synthetase
LGAGHGAAGAGRTLTLLLAPLAPFAAEELWREVLGEADSVHVSAWPTFDPALAAEDTVTMVVQVNGKVRDRLEVATDISEQDALAAARASDGARRALEGHEVVNEVVRVPRLVNFVVR